MKSMTSITIFPQAGLNANPHPFAHLEGFYWLTNPLSENQLLRKGWDREAIAALPDVELTALMKDVGSSHEWMQFLLPTRISSLLGNRFAELMTYCSAPVEERIRLRLACLILRERLSQVPYYAQKEAKWGEQFWITYQSGCYNE